MSCKAQEIRGKSISKNKMNLSWHFSNDRIYFEMTAPTNGWVTIGFNTNESIKNAYLLMGNIINDKVNVVEHYTLEPGHYKSLLELGEQPQVNEISGNQNSKGSMIKFSLPIMASSKYQKDLTEGSEYTMILAYSQEDDFQHHSMMRTSAIVKL